MHTRIRQVINLTANGKLKEFAEIMGWTPQYVTNLVSGRVGIGISPVVAILKKYPSIDARWLLLGEGAVYKPDIIERTKANLRRLMELEKYVPYMNFDELEQYNNGHSDFGQEQIERWESIKQQII